MDLKLIALVVTFVGGMVYLILYNLGQVVSVVQTKTSGMKIHYMRGILGQYVFTLPEKNAVIVRLGHKRSDTYTADQHYPDDINTWLDAAMDLLQ